MSCLKYPSLALDPRRRRGRAATILTTGKSAVEQTDLEVVPLTELERSYLVDAWLSYVHALPAGIEPDLESLLRNPIFKTTMNRILVDHDFEPFTATFRWDPDEQLVILARRLPSARPLDGT